MEYSSRESAQQAADYIKDKHGTTMYEYKCKKCRKWHLSPVRYIETSYCEFCDKKLYATEEDAEEMASRREQQGETGLSVYPCQELAGWHLTSKW